MLIGPLWLPEKWSFKRNRRKFFEAYAEANEFEFNNPHNWYKQSTDSIMAFEVTINSFLFLLLIAVLNYLKGAERVTAYHNNSVVKALLDLFPDIGLDKAQFALKCMFDFYRFFIFSFF